MIERKFVVALAVATIGLNLIFAGGVAAKASHCGKDCKPDISRCLADVPTSKSCAGTAAEKKACRKMLAGQRKTCHGLVTRCKQQNPSMSGTCTTVTTTTVTTTSTTLRFTDLGDGTVQDNYTGLQWEQKENLRPLDPTDLHGVRNTYSWAGCCNGDCTAEANYCQPNAAAAATCAAQSSGGTHGCSVCGSGTCNTGAFTTTVWDWVNQVNAANFAGHSDWRLPSESACNTCWTGMAVFPTSCTSCSAHELETILAGVYPTCQALPCIPSIFGITEPFAYWSAATFNLAPYGLAPTLAWHVEFFFGSVAPDDKASAYHVRAVRGGS